MGVMGVTSEDEDAGIPESPKPDGFSLMGAGVKALVVGVSMMPVADPPLGATGSMLMLERICIEIAVVIKLFATQ